MAATPMLQLAWPTKFFCIAPYYQSVMSRNQNTLLLLRKITQWTS